MKIVAAPTGLSFYTAGTETVGGVAGTLPTIFGGYAGSAGSCQSADQYSTCNSCAGGGTELTPCNQTSIHPNLRLSITLQSSTAATFQQTPRAKWQFTGTANSAEDVDSSPSLIAGQPFVVEISWSKLCERAGAGTNCNNATSAITKTLNVGIDNNNDGNLDEKVDFNFVFRYVDASSNTEKNYTPCPPGTPPSNSSDGLCDYHLTKGDEKVIILDYAASSYDMQTSNAAVKFNRAVFFYQENVANGAGIRNNDANFVVDITPGTSDEDPPTIGDKRLMGLVNGTPYCFAMGNMDQTGNISRFTPASILTSNLPSDLARICATPEIVVGLLDDKSCFIATATFGSNMAPEVQTFREFRNRFLAPSSWGQAFIKVYYKYGPEGAEWISHSPFLKGLSLAVLWPLLMFVKLSLAWGLIPAALMVLVGAITLKKSFTLIRQNRRLKGAL